MPSLDPRLGRIFELQQIYSALQQDLPLVEERVDLLRAVIADNAVPGLADPDSDASLAQHQYELGVAMYEYFMHVNKVDCLVEAEAHLRQALLGLTSSLGAISVLGSVLRERAYITSSRSLAEEALSLHRTPFPTPQSFEDLVRAQHCRELGLTLRVIWYTNADAELFLVESVEQLKAARTLFAKVGVNDRACCAGLVRALVNLYNVQTNKVHLSEASSIGNLVLTQCGSDHRDLYQLVWAVSTMHCFLAWYCDDTGALPKAIDILRPALTTAPSGWAIPLTIQLVDTLRVRFMKQGDIQDVSEAVAKVTTLLDGLSPEAPQWNRLQGALSDVLFIRFRVTGATEDIDSARRAAELAVSSAEVGTAFHLQWLHQAAVCQIAQYRAVGDITLLNQNVMTLGQLVQAAPAQSSILLLAKQNLLDSLRTRAEATENLSDLDQAIELIPDSFVSQAFDHPNAPTMLHQIGSVFLLRYEMTGSLEDLERATIWHKEAVHMSATKSCPGYEHHLVLNAHAKVLRIRYEVLGEEESGVTALAQQKQVADTLPAVHGDRTGVLCELAHTLVCISAGQGDVDMALDHLLDALNNDYCPAYGRLKDVMNALTYLAKRLPCLNHDTSFKLSVVYSAAISLLPQVASFGLDPRARLAVISGAGQLTAQGAAHAISIGQHELALEMLEAGRSVFWTQGLRLRTSFTGLPGEIGDRLARITSALGQPMPEYQTQGSARDHELARRRRLGDEFAAVLAEARLLPGFEGLLRNAPYSSLSQAARQHPVVIFVAGGSTGHALIISENSQCTTVALAKATDATLRALSHRMEMHSAHIRSSRGMRKTQATEDHATDVFRELWTLVMAPIVDALGWPEAHGQARSRLTLCPTGVFMQLPLHAAGIYRGDNPACCSDYFVSTYIPSTGAVLHAQQTYRPVRRADANALVVAVEHPFQGTALPLTSNEAHTVRKHMSVSANVTQVSKSEDVLEHIRSASVLHMACHGTQNLADALQSGFFLEDTLLSASKLMQLDLPRAFLAVLSACETAKGDASQPDQAIHLAATMLFAGFTSVVATMWYMRDLEGPDVADSIYSALFKDDGSEYLDPDAVPYALDQAVSKMRAAGLDLSFWATYVHIGI